MLRTRLWMGTLLIALAAAMLALDRFFAPYYPFLFVFCTVVGALAAFEAVRLLGPERSPPRWFAVGAVLVVLAANWPAHVWPGLPADTPWHLVFASFTAVVMLAFVVEIAAFRVPGQSVAKVATATWLTAYLGVLPSFFAQLRWLPADADRMGEWRGVAALALAIFVPKACDIGAFFSGKLLGRHRMTPILSPNKTWEGLAGGVLLAVVVAVGLNRAWPVLAGGDAMAVGFGVTVGLVGAIGDLAESLIKRDCGQKDASQTVPGFGGVLDVVDSIVFAAPVAYLWLRL